MPGPTPPNPMTSALGGVMDGALSADGGAIQRDAPDPPEARRALVAQMTANVSEARAYWAKGAFARMIEDMRFAAGRQWPGMDAPADAKMFVDETQDRYVANIVLRHLHNRTAALYGKNPTIVARTKERLLSSVWDGQMSSLQAATVAVQSGVPDPMSAAVVQDAMKVMAEKTRLNKVGKTLELLFNHEISEQPLNFKVQMKATVRRALTTGVGYVKLGFQRVMGQTPDVAQETETVARQLAALERLAADRADGELDDTSAQMEQLRLVLKELAAKTEIVVREGLTFTYPHSTAIIPDRSVQQLRGFVGAEWVAEEYFLKADQIKEIYKRDVSVAAPGTDGPLPKLYERTQHHQYRPSEAGSPSGLRDRGGAYHCVWEIYNRADGLVYVVCDGYPDFLTEPAAPDVKLETFFPWFPFVVNEVYDDDTVFPPSDVRLMRDQQLELNRGRQGLREHRRAARPKTFARKSVLSTDDKDALQESKAHDVIELEGLMPSEKIQDVLQPYSGPPIDPTLYDPSPVYEDYQRVLGQQEANLGGTSGATATEAAIAEGSRASGASSVVDDLDEFLTELVRNAGQVLLSECSPEKVKLVVGPGAVWPDLSRAEIMREVYLDVEAASTGRPNKAAEIQNAQLIFPMLMQIPGLSPEWMAKEMLRRLDDKLDLTDAFAAGLPSIQMMNATAQALAPDAAASGADPRAQGGQGAGNAPSTEPAQVNTAPRPPIPPTAAPAQPPGV